MQPISVFDVVINLLTIFRDQEIVDKGTQNTPLEQSLHNRTKEAIWNVTRLASGYDPEYKLDLRSCLELLSRQRLDVHQLLSRHGLEYSIANHDGILVGEVTELRTGVTLFCQITERHDPEDIHRIMTKSSIQVQPLH